MDALEPFDPMITVFARSEIPTAHRVVGMKVFDIQDGKSFIWLGGVLEDGWVPADEWSPPRTWSLQCWDCDEIVEVRVNPKAQNVKLNHWSSAYFVEHYVTWAQDASV